MQKYIINSYILNPHGQTLESINNYIKTRYDNLVKYDDLQVELRKLCKNEIIYKSGLLFILTEKGKYILNDTKYFYARQIVEFFKKCVMRNKPKKHVLKEIREEQKKLRDYLIINKAHKCILCNKKMPLCLLETAHLIPRCVIKPDKRSDPNLVEFMCRYCHKLYDNGLLGVDMDGKLVISSKLSGCGYELSYQPGHIVISYTSNNSEYFAKHMRTIFNF